MPCFDGELSEILVHPLGTPFNVSDNHANHLCPGLYARARVMGFYSFKGSPLCDRPDSLNFVPPRSPLRHVTWNL